MPVEAAAELSLEETIALAADDGVFYGHAFFPRTCRMPSPRFHYQLEDLLSTPDNRLKNVQMFRGSAKTSRLRLFVSRRVAYGISKTILYVGKSEGAAVRSLDWLRKAVLHNYLWTSAFGLTKGSKFQGTEAEIRHHALEESIWVVAVGIEGAVRGINLDDYRPDLIVLDDVIQDENAATPDGRQKLNDLIFGALKNSLQAPGENPLAAMVMLNTPINREDASVLAHDDPEFYSLRLGCWTPATEDLSLEERCSSWPEMFPSSKLREEKKHAIARGQGHIFSREMECKLVDPERAPLRTPWINYYELLPERRDFQRVVLSVDPVPKPTPTQVAKNLHGKDWEVLQVWGRYKDKIMLMGWKRNRGHEPNWTVTAFWELWRQFRFTLVRVDSVAYQSTLSWILSESMRKEGIYVQIDEITADRRSKYDKCIDAYSGPGSQGAIWLPHNYPEFVDQWCNFPDIAHDDDLDCGHMAVEFLNGATLASEDYEVLLEEEEEVPDLPASVWSCP